jgi:hypothetical protein
MGPLIDSILDRAAGHLGEQAAFVHDGARQHRGGHRRSSRMVSLISRAWNTTVSDLIVSDIGADSFTIARRGFYPFRG